MKERIELWVSSEVELIQAKFEKEKLNIERAALDTMLVTGMATAVVIIIALLAPTFV